MKINGFALNNFVKNDHNLLPLLPPSLLVLSVGTGVISSILPIFMPSLAKALKAAWAPGPGVFDWTPTMAEKFFYKWITSSCS